jgi:dienelactone hydrolase
MMVDRAIPEFPEWPEPVADLRDGSAGEIYFATITPFDFEVLLRGPEAAIPTTGRGTLLLPETQGEEPVPAMVLLHGSGGITPGREMEYGRRLAERGIAAFVLEYYAPRGMTEETPYMLRVLSVTEFDIIADAYAALKLLSTHPAIDPERIGVAGFSYGGMAARFALDERFAQILAPEHPGFALHVDYYGPCFQNLRTRSARSAPLLTLRGTEDRSNDLVACHARELELSSLGVEVEAHVYEGAGHAWEADIPRALHPDAPYVAGCEIVYDPSGRSSLNGNPINDLPASATRRERILARATSGNRMEGCVGKGYLIGRDDAVLARSDAHLFAFLEKVFGP